MALVNIGIAGCLGKMGQELVKEIAHNELVNFAGGFEHLQHEGINKKISDFVEINTEHIVSDNPRKIFSDSNVIIDFTTPQSTLQNISIAIELNKPIVIGTTGLNKNIMDAIKKCSETTPILQSSNMSVGVNLIFDFVHYAASKLKDVDYDIEISESHHKYKVDAPSGTAITLGELAAKGRKVNFNDVKELDRIKLTSARKKGNIGFAVTRGGEIAGDHTISFIGKNDRIDLIHQAYNRSIFVKGAIEAAVFLSKQKKGLYSIKDINEHS